MEETMNIVIGASREYSMYAPVLLTSLFENNCRHKFTIYYYYSENIDDILLNIKKICTDFGNTLIPMFVSGERLKGTDAHGTWHDSTWYRYLCLEDLKGKCERVLLMGTDIIVMKDISGFYFQKLGDKCMAAVQDSVNMYEWYILYDECKERNKDIKKYVNADVILFDIAKAGDVICLEKMLEIYKNTEVYCMDQGILNYFYSDYIKIIMEYDYNFGVNAAFETMEKDKYIEMVNNMSVLHFAGRKPWDDYDDSYAHSIWMDYCKKTPYYNMIKDKLIISLQQKKGIEKKKACKLDKLLDVMDRLWEESNNGVLIENLKRKKLNCFAIYGYGRLGKHFLNICIKNKIEVKCIIDSREIKDIDNIRTFRVDDIKQFDKKYPIVVTAVYDYKEIKQKLQSKAQVDIYSLEELL